MTNPEPTEMAELLDADIEHFQSSRARAASNEQLDRAIAAAQKRIEQAVRNVTAGKIKVTGMLDAQA